MPEYKSGDVVLVRAVVRGHEKIDNEPVAYSIELDDRHGAHRIWVCADTVIEPYVPEEPDKNLLIVGESGTAWTYRKDGWYAVGGSGYGRTWCKEFYTVHGPFNIFKPDGEV